MTAPTPNAELAYRVLDHIDANPSQWRQGAWYVPSECGTTACFAGWAVLLSGAKVNAQHARVIEGPAELIGLDVPEAADKLLGISTKLLADNDIDDPYDGLLDRADLGRLVAEIFGPRPLTVLPVDEDTMDLAIQAVPADLDRPGGEGGSATDGAA